MVIEERKWEAVSEHKTWLMLSSCTPFIFNSPEGNKLRMNFIFIMQMCLLCFLFFCDEYSTRCLCIFFTPIVLYYVVLCCVALCCVMLCCILFYFIVLCCVILYCVVLCCVCVMLCRIVLCVCYGLCVVLWFVVLF